MLAATVALLTATMLGPGPANAARVTDDLPRTTITAATYNVCKVNCSRKYSWARRRSAVVRTVHDAAPDVLAVQEAPTLPWRSTTQWADLTRLLAAAGYQQPSDLDGCSPSCTRGAHLYFNPSRLRVFSMPRPSALGYSPTVEAVGMGSQRTLSGIGWGPIQDRNLSWAYLQDIATGTVFLAVSVHLPNEKTAAGEQVRQAVARNLPGWVEGLNAERGLAGVPVLVMGDLNSYESRQPDGAQWLLQQAGFVDAFDATQRIHARIGTVNFTPAIRQWEGFPPEPFKYTHLASRIDYIFGKNGVVPLAHEVVLHLREDGTFDPGYRGSDHNLVRAQLSLPIVAR